MRTWIASTVLTVLSACASSGPSPQGPVSRQPEPQSAPEVTPPAASAAPVPTQTPAAASSTQKTFGPEVAAKLSKIRFDPAPPATTRGRHYFTSNEHSPELFRKPVNGLGGIVTGVGAEQMYLLGAWARAEVLVLTDFDDWIVDLHEVYGTLFLAHDNIDAFLGAWGYRGQKDVERALKERFPAHENRWRKWRAFGQARAEVKKRLTTLRTQFRKAGIASFLTDESEYDWLRKLWREKRVRAVRGDLTQNRALADLAAFAKQARLPVRVVYLSNAEDYFSFSTRHYRANILAQPFDAKSVILRTRPYKGSEYEYVVQPALSFQAWLKEGKVASMCELVRYAEPTAKGSDLFMLSAKPGATRARKYLCD